MSGPCVAREAVTPARKNSDRSPRLQPGEVHTWRDPPDDLVVLDGNALRDWMLGARPELCRALDEAHGVVGLDGGEYIMDAPDLLVVNRRRGVRKDKLHLSDDRKFFSVTVAEG